MTVLYNFAAALRPLWANPVVVRDLRVQMRGVRSYIQMAAFLLLLGVLSLAGYASATATASNASNIVEMQQKLQTFYYFIFVTLAALTCLIAPALTAASVTSERQRQTLDLLVTTPMTAAQMLIGKLLASVAFLALLLMLSLPASTLCVLLGGATLADVLQVYLTLLVDGLLLASIGLFFSAAQKTSLAALVWTYMGVIGFLSVTGMFVGFAMSTSYGSGSSGPSTHVNPLAVVAALNPFGAVMSASRTFQFFGLPVPVWLGSVVLAVVLIRLFTTAATYRLGLFGTRSIPSLRRQILGLTAFTSVLSFYSLAQGTGSTTSGVLPGFSSMIVMLFLCALPFLPSLFAPFFGEDVQTDTVIRERYNIRKAFEPVHEGSLPYFHLWLLTVLLSATLGILLAPFDLIGGGTGGRASFATLHTDTLIGYFLLATFYVSGLGFLCWSLARRAASLVVGLSAARALAFGLYLLIGLLPLMLAALSNGWEGWKYFWLMYPLTEWGNEGAFLGALIQTGVMAYVLGLLAYPFWRPVKPFIPNRVRTQFVPVVAGGIATDIPPVLAAVSPAADNRNPQADDTTTRDR